MKNIIRKEVYTKTEKFDQVFDSSDRFFVEIKKSDKEIEKQIQETLSGEWLLTNKLLVLTNEEDYATVLLMLS